MIATLGEKDHFKLAGRDTNLEFRTVSSRKQKAAPGQVLAERKVLLGKNCHQICQEKSPEGQLRQSENDTEGVSGEGVTS